MLESVVFYSLSAVILGSALCVVLLRNVIHSALFLGLSLAGVAGLFMTLGADFLAAAQILIYVSGIAVLILFVVMLAGRASDLLLRQVNEQWAAALVVCGILVATVSRYLVPFRLLGAAAPQRPTTETLGRLLLGTLAVPFELISIVLMVALVGAVYFSKTETAATQAREAKEATEEPAPSAPR